MNRARVLLCLGVASVVACGESETPSSPLPGPTFGPTDVPIPPEPPTECRDIRVNARVLAREEALNPFTRDTATAYTRDGNGEFQPTHYIGNESCVRLTDQKESLRILETGEEAVFVEFEACINASDDLLVDHGHYWMDSRDVWPDSELSILDRCGPGSQPLSSSILVFPRHFSLR